MLLIDKFHYLSSINIHFCFLSKLAYNSEILSKFASKP